MAKTHKPRKGSRAFWPRKRAKRIYPNVQTFPESDKAAPLVFAAYKAGMTRAKFTDMRKGSATSGDEVVRPVTVLECPPLKACGIRVYSKTPYGLKDEGVVWEDGISKDMYRKTNTPKKPARKAADMEKLIEKAAEVRLLVHTMPRQSSAGKKKPELFELRLGGKEPKEKWEYAKSKLGSELKISDVFSEGDFADAVAVTRGKGFQGPVKRFGVKIRPRKHEKKRRHVGNIGAVTPGRVLPGAVAMPGQHGFQTRTEYNKRIMKLGDAGSEMVPAGGFVGYGGLKSGYALIAGSVPGPKKRLIILRKPVRQPGETPKDEFKKVLLDSQQ